METQHRSTVPQHVVVTSTKSVGIQILLVIFLGPLGLFYSTIKGALIMLIGVPLLFVVFTAAIGAGAAASGRPGAGTYLAYGASVLMMLAAWWIGSFIWGVNAVNAFNRKLLQQAF
jgi:hypothetical protein